MLQMTKISTALIALTLALGAWVVAAPVAVAQDEDGLKTVTATGEGATKDQARDDALRKAVEKGAGVVITSRTETLDHAVAFDRIVSRSRGYVKSFTEGEVKKDPISEMWKFTITAQVATGKIKDDWGDIQLLLQQKGQPTIMVLIRETIRNSENESLPASTSYCARAIEKKLLEKGFRVKSVAGLKEKERRERDAAILAEDKAALGAIARNYGADVVIAGDMTCRFDAKVESFGGWGYRYLATATLEAFRSDTADKLGVAVVSGRRNSTGHAQAQELSLTDAAKGVGDEILRQILNQWYFEFQAGQRFELKVTIQADAAKKMRHAEKFSEKFQNALKEDVEGVVEVNEESYDLEDGKVELTLTVVAKLDQKQLRGALGDLDTEGAGYWIQFTGGKKNSLRYDLNIE